MDRRQQWRTIVRGMAVGIAVLLVGAQAALASGVTWTTPSTVAPAYRIACGHALGAGTTAAQTTVHTVYTNLTGGWLIDPPDIYYRRSGNLGATWAPSVRLSGSSITWKDCPTVAASGATVVVAWLEGGRTATAIRLRTSRDAGRTWSAERRIPAKRAPGSPSLAVVGARIYVAWTDASGSERWSRYAISPDRGVTWTVGRLDPTTASAGDTNVGSSTQIAASGSTVFAGWIRSNGRDLMGRRSTNGGATWSTPIRLATLATPGGYDGKWARSFSVAARPDRLAVSWGDAVRVPDLPSPAIHVRVYAGGTWRAPTELTAVPPTATAYGQFRGPVVMLLAWSRVGLTWAGCIDIRPVDPYSELVCDDYAGNSDADALWSESTDNGSTWSEATVVASSAPYPVAGRISSTWLSSRLRGVLVGHANGHLSFMRGFDAP